MNSRKRILERERFGRHLSNNRGNDAWQQLKAGNDSSSYGRVMLLNWSVHVPTGSSLNGSKTKAAPVVAQVGGNGSHVPCGVCGEENAWGKGLGRVSGLPLITCLGEGVALPEENRSRKGKVDWVRDWKFGACSLFSKKRRI